MPRGRTIQFGVINVGHNTVETVGEVARRLRDALEVVGSARLIAAPDCGCTALPRDIARTKLDAMVGSARIVRAEIDKRR